MAQPAWNQERRGKNRSPTIAASAYQICGGVRSHDRRAKTTIPVRLPRMSAVYARTRFGIASNARPITWPRPTNVSAISTKKRPATASIGTTNCDGSGAANRSVPKKTCCGESCPPTLIMYLRETRVEAVTIAQATATRAIGKTILMKSRRRPADIRPTDIPRKQASRTRFVKNVRKSTVLPNQRMHASSKKRIRKLIRKRST